METNFYSNCIMEFKKICGKSAKKEEFEENS